LHQLRALHFAVRKTYSDDDHDVVLRQLLEPRHIGLTDADDLWPLQFAADFVLALQAAPSKKFNYLCEKNDISRA
jgi:hypothetical protein